MKQFLLTMVSLATIATAGQVFAQAGTQVFSQELEDKLIDKTFAHFWGNAVDSRGRPLEPANAQERRTLPLDRDESHRILDFAAYSGVAQWCGVDWKPRFALYMQLMRKLHLHNDKQVAFAGMLHAVGQQVVVGSQNGKTCPEEKRQNIEQVFAKEVAQLKKLTAKK